MKKSFDKSKALCFAAWCIYLFGLALLVYFGVSSGEDAPDWLFGYTLMISSLSIWNWADMAAISKRLDDLEAK